MKAIKVQHARIAESLHVEIVERDGGLFLEVPSIHSTTFGDIPLRDFWFIPVHNSSFILVLRINLGFVKNLTRKFLVLFLMWIEVKNSWPAFFWKLMKFFFGLCSMTSSLNPWLVLVVIKTLSHFLSKTFCLTLLQHCVVSIQGYNINTVLVD